jgi:hypothetical protein
VLRRRGCVAFQELREIVGVSAATLKRARWRSRDAIAATSSSGLLRMPGTTRCVPISAVERMPQRTGVMSVPS